MLLDRYIVRELIPPLLLTMVITTFIFFLDKLVWLASLVVRNNLDFATSWRFLCYTVPTVSSLTLPIAFLIGCTLTFTRLSMDSEYVILRASGVSVLRLMRPLLAVAVIMYALASALLIYVSPWGFQKLRALFFEVARSSAYYYLQAREFNDTFQGLVLYVERTNPELQRLEGLFISHTPPGTAPDATSQVITARSGTLLVLAEERRVMLHLEDGAVHRYDPVNKRYYLLRFHSHDIALEIDARVIPQGRDEVRPREWYPARLLAETQRLKALGRDKDVRQLQVYWHKLFALPFACFIFAGLGPSLGVVQPRAGRAGGYIFGFGAIFLYYLFLAASDAVGEASPVIPPVLAAWFPNLCMGGMTLWLIQRTAHDRAPLNVTWFWEWAYRFWSRPQ